MTHSEKRPLIGNVIAEEELTGCDATLPCNPRRALHRYLILIILCFLSFGCYFCYDNPAALQDTMTHDLGISVSQFMGFYSWYSWPNVILCFFGGLLIDRVLGVRLGAIIFNLFVTAGQIVFATGALLNKYWLMCVGRFIFGIGGESLIVAQNAYAVKWFQGKTLNMVFGLQLSFCRVGSTLNMNVMQPLYNAISKTTTGFRCLGMALFVGGLTCIFSLMCALGIGYFDKRADRILQRGKVASGHRSHFLSSSLCGKHVCGNTQVLQLDEVIHIRDVKDFSFKFWLLCVICVSYYVAVFPFIGLGLVFFEMKFDLEPTPANSCDSLVYIISAVACPLFGFLIDKIGKNVFWVIVAITVSIGCHGLMAFTFASPYAAMAILGVSYSVLASALWPMASLVVKRHQLGTAYGIMQAIQNLGLASIALAAGSIVDNKGYLILEVFFLAWLCIALMAAMLLYLIDAAQGGALNKSASLRKKERELAELKKGAIN